MAWNLPGLCRNSLISWSSSIASSAPATSAKVVFGVSLVISFARDLPKFITGAATLHLVHENEEEQEDNNERQPPEQHAEQRVSLRVKDVVAAWQVTLVALALQDAGDPVLLVT